MIDPWKYLENQFESATRNNYKKAVKVSTYHDAQLNTQKAIRAALIPIYNRYHTVHEVLNTAYDQWKSAGGSQKGQTQNVSLLYDAALEHLPAWDVAIQTIYLKGTPQYTAIFPNGKKPFNSGSIDDKINSFNTLQLNLAPYDDLLAVKAEVAEIYAGLDAAREIQEGSKGNVNVNSSAVETARVAAMNMQYRDLGFVMDAYSAEPDYIANLFDLETLRNREQTEFTGTLKPSKSKGVLVRTFVADSQITLRSEGTGAIRFYLATTAKGTNSGFIEVTEAEERVVTAADFTPVDYATHRYLTAINQSTTATLHYEVELG